jgi:hypothetical protein
VRFLSPFNGVTGIVGAGIVDFSGMCCYSPFGVVGGGLEFYALFGVLGEGLGRSGSRG